MSDAISLVEGADYQPDVQFTPRLLAASGGAAPVALGDDALMNVEFYDKRVPVPSKSTAESIHFDKKTYVRISRPGDDKQVFDNPAKQNHMKRFPMQYQAYLTGKSQVNGTPIERLLEMGVLQKGQIEMIKLSGMSAIEQVAGASSSAIAGWGDEAKKIQDLCKGYVNQRANIEQSAESKEVRNELEALRAELAELRKNKAPKKGKKEELVIE